MTKDEFERAFIAFEDEHGEEALLDAVADILKIRLERKGQPFEDDEDELRSLRTVANGRRRSQ